MFSKPDNVNFNRALLRAAIPALLSALVVWLLFDHVSNIDLAALRQSVEGFSVATWIMALACTWLSFVAVSHYDPLVCAKLDLDIPKKRAASMGWKATAISQTTGFGLITGTMMRWLELGFNPNKGKHKLMPQAFGITCAVSISFLLGWLIVTALVTAFANLGGVVLTYAGAAVCISIIAAIIVPDTNRVRVFFAKHLHLIVALSGLAFVDTFFATAVISLFLPPDIVPFIFLYQAFLLSYALGLVSGLPGGMGPFEICMITLLPQVDLAVLAPALLAFRIAYFAIPAACALCFLAIQAPWRMTSRTPYLVTDSVPGALLESAPPDVDLMTSGNIDCLSTNDASEAALIYQTDNCIVQVGNTFGTSRRGEISLRALARNARWSKRSLSIYRCDKFTAMRARKIGLKHFRFSSEAILQTGRFSLATPERANLRRKIRQAGRAGVTINSKPHTLSDLVQIDREWADRKRIVRGFSTGTFSVDHISKQRIYTAFVDGRAVAFTTFGISQKQWLLDIMRYSDDCPPGTIYALVAQAIEDARLRGIDTVSLGSVPFAPTEETVSKSDRLRKFLYQKSETLQGLYQFKRSFDPLWQDRYFATRSLASFIRCTITILKAIYRKPPADHKITHSS